MITSDKTCFWVQTFYLVNCSGDMSEPQEKKELASSSSGSPTAEPSPPRKGDYPDIDLADEEVRLAAIKIQSTFRKHMAEIRHQDEKSK